MKKALAAAIATIFMGYLGTVIGYEIIGNFREFGSILAVAVMGGFVIYFQDKKK